VSNSAGSNEIIVRAKSTENLMAARTIPEAGFGAGERNLQYTTERPRHDGRVHKKKRKPAKRQRCTTLFANPKARNSGARNSSTHLCVGKGGERVKGRSGPGRKSESSHRKAGGRCASHRVDHQKDDMKSRLSPKTNLAGSATPSHDERKNNTGGIDGREKESKCTKGGNERGSLKSATREKHQSGTDPLTPSRGISWPQRCQTATCNRGNGRGLPVRSRGGGVGKKGCHSERVTTKRNANNRE